MLSITQDPFCRQVIQSFDRSIKDQDVFPLNKKEEKRPSEEEKVPQAPKLQVPKLQELSSKALIQKIIYGQDIESDWEGLSGPHLEQILINAPSFEVFVKALERISYGDVFGRYTEEANVLANQILDQIDGKKEATKSNIFSREASASPYYRLICIVARKAFESASNAEKEKIIQAKNEYIDKISNASSQLQMKAIKIMKYIADFLNRTDVKILLSLIVAYTFFRNVRFVLSFIN